MHFDREALKGIYEALSEAERESLDWRLIWNSNIRLGLERLIVDEDLHIVQEEMVKLGFIVEFETPAIEVAAEEYEEIMRSLELVREG